MAACALCAPAATPYAFAQAPTPAAAPVSGITLPGHVPPLVNSSALLGPVLGAQTLSLALTLPLRDPLGLGALLHDLYDAASPRHGQFLTPPQFADQFGPTQADYDALTAWAQSKGLTVTGTNPSRTILDVTADAATVQQAFGVHLSRYLDPTGREFYAPDADPTVDPSLAGELSGIIGLDNAAVTQSRGVVVSNSPSGGTGYGRFLSPTDITSAYGLSSTTLNGAGQTLGLFELTDYNQNDQEVVYDPNDILGYESGYHLPQVPVVSVSVDGGGPATQNDRQEATADVELQIALAPGASRVIVYYAPNTLQAQLDEYNKIATDNQAKQISTSWAGPESGYSSQFIFAENSAFLQMATQGQTLYAASGDNGSNADGSNRGLDNPASQPLICAVGGTLLSNNGTGGAWSSETCWNNYGDPTQSFQGASGGGISTFWPIPCYQSQPGVYTSASKGSFNNRTVPDVALNASPDAGYSFYCKGTWGGYAGTSCAAPLWAGFTALVNQQRAASGLAPLGLANASLYQIARGTNYASDFHDVVTGNNLFYPAVTGYDEATGWGTMNGASLLQDLAALRAPATVPRPFYRLSNAASTSFLYTDYINDAASASSGFTYRFVDCHVYGNINDVPGLVSFYRLYDPNNGDHLMTTSTAERDYAINNIGYQLDGTVCYLFPTTAPQPSGTVPLYRAYNTSTGQHFYTKNQAEYGGLSVPPWQPEGVCAYVLF